MICSLRYTWLDLYDGEPVINPQGKEEDEDDAICPVQVEQTQHSPSRETHSDTEGTQQAEHGEEALVCERQAYEYIYRMYEAALRKEIRQQRMRGDTYTWQVRSKCTF